MVKPEYKISYNKSRLLNLLFEKNRINLRYFLCGPPKSDEEGIYYRFIHNQDKLCIQCIVFYKTQWIPYHPHDYHPFYIYLTADDELDFILIDDGHHFSKLIPIKNAKGSKPVNITIFLPDHGLTDQLNWISRKFYPKLIPLTPDQIKKWWLINNMAQLKLRTKLIDPWAPGLIPITPSKKESLIYRINHLIPLKIFQFTEEKLLLTFRDESICPICQDVQTLDFMTLKTQKTSKSFFLEKKMVCSNKHHYKISYNFETGTIEYQNRSDKFS